MCSIHAWLEEVVGLVKQLPNHFLRSKLDHYPPPTTSYHRGLIEWLSYVQLIKMQHSGTLLHGNSLVPESIEQASNEVYFCKHYATSPICVL